MTGARWEAVAADVRRAMTPRGRQQLGCFPIEGRRVVARALTAGAPVTHLLFGQEPSSRPSEWADHLRAEARQAGVTIATGPGDALEALTEGRTFGAVVGLVRLPTQGSLTTALTRAGQPAGHVQALVAVDVLDPGNLGALMRTALVSGVPCFVTVGGTDPFHPKTVRTSMGSIFRLEIHTTRELTEALGALEDPALETLAMTPRGGTPLRDVPEPTRPRVLMVGGEAHGLPAPAIEGADVRVSVPMIDRVDSYSVNASAAIALYALQEAAGSAGSSPLF